MPGPHVQVATLCEKALQEADGVLSIIRAIDRVIVTAQGSEVPSELPQGNLQLTLVVILKSDGARGGTQSRYGSSSQAASTSPSTPSTSCSKVRSEG